MHSNARLKTTFRIIIYLLFASLLIALLTDVALSTEKPSKDQDLILSPTEYPEVPHGTLLDQLKSRIKTQPFNLVAAIIFGLAILHTFCARLFTILAHKLRERNSARGLVHPDTFWVEILRFNGEVEVIFGLWAIPLLIAMAWFYDWSTSVEYVSKLHYTEPLFVVVIMAIASTKPIVSFAEWGIRKIAALGGPTVTSWWWSILTIGPLAGSLITEPGAMTISAMLLSRQFYAYEPSMAVRYSTLGLLFTNISIGGVFTNFAAPPVLMVSRAWNWDTPFMFETFGLKAVLGIFFSNLLYYLIFRKEFHRMEKHKSNTPETTSLEVPLWITLVQAALLAWMVIHASYPVLFIGSFLLFLGFYQATQSYQDSLELRTPILVGFFLAGLVIHGNLQAWWISPLLEKTTFESLMALSIVLTAFNDNAGITFLASLIPNLADNLKYAVMAGAVTGGGLTVIANAPNLPGQAILSKHFPYGVSVPYLFLGALCPMLIVAACFYLLRP